MARLMSSTELAARMESDEDFVLVDVLEPDHFHGEHIEGAINIPLDKLRAHALQLLNKNQRIVVYGENHDDERSNLASELLESMGFRKVADFDGGLYAWKRAGFFTTGPQGNQP